MRQTHCSRMSTPRLMKLRKLPNSTWAQLQKHLIALPDPFETLFPAKVWSFILNKSHSISTNPGYVSATLITTTAFMAGTATTLKTATQEMPLNIYSIFVGPPTTGKSQAIKECAISPMASVTAEADSASPVIQKCTSSRLIKTVAENNRGNTDSICCPSSRPIRSRTRSFRPIFNYIPKVLATDANANKPGN